MEKTNEMDENKAQMDARAKLLDCEDANAERGEASERERGRAADGGGGGGGGGESIGLEAVQFP
jgi:hypothetical protein